MSRNKFTYTHGDVGSKPPSSRDFAKGERPDAQHFDWWWSTVISSINGHADEFDRLDSNNDGIVDEADHASTAGDADTVDGQNYGDIQSWVNSVAYQPDGNDKFKFEVRNSDPSSPENGRAWIIE